MAKKDVISVAKTGAAHKATPKKVEKIQNGGVHKSNVNKDKTAFKKAGRNLVQPKKVQAKIKEESEDDDDDDDEEDKEDSGTDVVVKEEDDNDIEEEDDDDDIEEEDDEDDDEDEAMGEDDDDESEDIEQKEDSDEHDEENDMNADGEVPEETILKLSKKVRVKAKPTTKEIAISLKKARQVIIKNIKNLSNDDIKNHFAKFGEVGSKMIRPDMSTCILYFKRQVDAEEALKAHNTVLNGSKIGVYSNNAPELKRCPNKTIVLENEQNLTDVSSDDLTEIFEKYGEIQNLEILCRKTVLAFITYKTEDSVNKCMELNNQTVNNIKIVLSKFRTGKLPNTTIFVHNVKPGVTKEEVEQLFSVAGAIDNITVKPGHGTVKFKDTDGFCKSFMLNESLLRGQMIFVEPHSTKKLFMIHKKKPVLNQKRPMRPNQKGAPQKRFKKY